MYLCIYSSSLSLSDSAVPILNIFCPPGVLPPALMPSLLAHTLASYLSGEAWVLTDGSSPPTCFPPPFSTSCFSPLFQSKPNYPFPHMASCLLSVHFQSAFIILNTCLCQQWRCSENKTLLFRELVVSITTLMRCRPDLESLLSDSNCLSWWFPHL